MRKQNNSKFCCKVWKSKPSFISRWIKYNTVINLIALLGNNKCIIKWFTIYYGWKKKISETYK